MFRRKTFYSPVLAAAVLLSAPAAWAQSAVPAASGSASAARAFDIAPGPLAATLNRIAAQSGLVVSVNPDLVEGRQAPRISGTLTPAEAMRQALAGSSLELVVTDSGAMSVRALPAARAGVATLAVVAVTGRGDAAITEHSGSYTTEAVSIGKAEHSLREMPQSVSVVTRQRMDDQNITTLGESMRYVTGMRSNPTGTGVDNIESRGFLVGNYLIDGLPAKGGQGMWGNTLIDMGLYDRAEVWRGPTGLLEGAGEPSGTINLVRKRATADTAVQAAATVGSWNQRRVEVDVTGALNEEGSLRGRVVGIHDDRDSYLGNVWLRKTTLYGTLEYDFTRNTTLSVGATEQRGGSLVFVGLPLFADGRNPDVKRSTYLGSTNGTKDDYAHRYFAELEHRMDDGGRIKLSANQFLRGTELDRFMSNSFADPVTRTTNIRGTHQKSREEDRGLDVYLSKPLQMWGLKQEIVAGANYQTYQGGQVQGTFTTFRQNIDNPNLNLTIPYQDIGGTPKTEVKQCGVYSQARIKPWQPLTLLVGGRLAWWETTDPDSPSSNQAIDAKFVPTLGAIVDLNQNYSVYGSFNRIFAPQTERYANESILAPRTGKQVEVGLKGEFMERRLTTSLAVFRINDTNRAVSDPDNEDYSLAAGEVRSQGMETEVTGKITAQWDVTAGYAYTETKYVKALQDAQGQPFNSSFPRHNFSLWTKYRFAGGGLDRLSVGGGVRAVSKSYTQWGDTTWTQRPYAVFSVQAGYAITPNITASLTVNNLFDKTYFERLAGHEYRQTYYGEPRSVVLAVRGRF
jgi:outer membrane receptor for ferric coprogen and ferric-rhodotorulic acid